MLLPYRRNLTYFTLRVCVCVDLALKNLQFVDTRFCFQTAASASTSPRAFSSSVFSWREWWPWHSPSLFLLLVLEVSKGLATSSSCSPPPSKRGGQQSAEAAREGLPAGFRLTSSLHASPWQMRKPAVRHSPDRLLGHLTSDDSHFFKQRCGVPSHGECSSLRTGSVDRGHCWSSCRSAGVRFRIRMRPRR